MKFLTDSEYEKLLKGSVKPQEVILLEEKISKLEIEVSNTIRDNENLKKDHDLIIRRKDLEIDVKVSEATKELNTELAKLRLDNGNYKKETEILTKAFQNLGFDVKDMKDILNKLVDGIVSKNTIQLVK